MYYIPKMSLVSTSRERETLRVVCSRLKNSKVLLLVLSIPYYPNRYRSMIINWLNLVSDFQVNETLAVHEFMSNHE
jgi:hypothetical protein